VLAEDRFMISQFYQEFGIKTSRERDDGRCCPGVIGGKKGEETRMEGISSLEGKAKKKVERSFMEGGGGGLLHSRKFSRQKWRKGSERESLHRSLSSLAESSEIATAERKRRDEYTKGLLTAARGQKEESG